MYKSRMEESKKTPEKPATALRRGWTTGACATAAAKSAVAALLGEEFADPVEITLPGGQKPKFALAHERKGKDFAEAGIIKDAGDDPDVTHGAMIMVRISPGKNGSGISFTAGNGVGTITKPGLPIDVGEAAINPVPRQMIAGVIKETCARHGKRADMVVTVSVPDGEKISEKTWNPRLGILGGISILGTSGIVIPYSCSAWIHSIQKGIDVARAMGITHVVGVVGRNSETGVKKYLDLPEQAFIDMGDFAGGMLKYLRKNPVPRTSIAGGFAKMCKLANGAMDLHSARSRVDMEWLAGLLKEAGADEKTLELALGANTAHEILQAGTKAGTNLAALIAKRAENRARAILKDTRTSVNIIIVDRDQRIIADSSKAK